ncbi:MAG: hypothetical protein E7106_05035 [Prevotella sp.]|nr:hypothetical protein [Prevotella sp.]
MNIVLMMFRAPRPCRTDDMRAVAMPRWIRKGYDGLTFFGTIITHSEKDAEVFNQRFGPLKNHEMIHLYQARSTHNSWLLFYLRYGWYWLCASRYRKRLKNAGYRLNPFEMEAYAHMNDLHYLDDKSEGVYEWRKFAQMPLSERYLHYTK